MKSQPLIPNVWDQKNKASSKISYKRQTLLISLASNCHRSTMLVGDLHLKVDLGTSKRLYDQLISNLSYIMTKATYGWFADIMLLIIGLATIWSFVWAAKEYRSIFKVDPH